MTWELIRSNGRTDRCFGDLPVVFAKGGHTNHGAINLRIETPLVDKLVLRS